MKKILTCTVILLSITMLNACSSPATSSDSISTDNEDKMQTSTTETNTVTESTALIEATASVVKDTSTSTSQASTASTEVSTNTMSSTSNEPSSITTGVKQIKPVPSKINVNKLADGDYNVRVHTGDISDNGDGTSNIKLEIYDLAEFSPEDIESMKVGDSIFMDGSDLQVKTLNYDTHYYFINGGGPNGDGGGRDLSKDQTGMYSEEIIDYGGDYIDIGSAVLKTSPTFQYTNIDMGETKHVSDAAGLSQWIVADGLDGGSDGHVECCLIAHVVNGILESLTYDFEI